MSNLIGCVLTHQLPFQVSCAFVSVYGIADRAFFIRPTSQYISASLTSPSSGSISTTVDPRTRTRSFPPVLARHQPQPSRDVTLLTTHQHTIEPFLMSPLTSLLLLLLRRNKRSNLAGDSDRTTVLTRGIRALSSTQIRMTTKPMKTGARAWRTVFIPRAGEDQLVRKSLGVGRDLPCAAAALGEVGRLSCLQLPRLSLHRFPLALPLSTGPVMRTSQTAAGQ
jgi:hypothetical protein